MSKIDIIEQICVFCDYPHHRANLKKYRDRINKIILYPSRHHGFRDFEGFLKEQIKETWAEPVEIDFSTEDWRQAETTPLLKYSDAEWLWFREADFFVDDWDKFYTDVDKLLKTSDMFGWYQYSHFKGGFVHPCCNFIKRELFEKTQKDFKAHPEIDGCDHFAMLTRDAEKLGAKIVKLQDIGYKDWENAFHLGGMSYPAQNWGSDRIFGVGNKEAFFVYNYFSRQVPDQHPEYLKLSYEIEDYMKRNEGMSEVDPLTSRFRKFYE